MILMLPVAPNGTDARRCLQIGCRPTYHASTPKGKQETPTSVSGRGSSSEPGPVAPISEVRSTLQFAVERVPRKKILLGLPLYGYDWIIPYQPGTLAEALSNQEAVLTAMRYQSPIQYSFQYESPFFDIRMNLETFMRYGLKMSEA